MNRFFIALSRVVAGGLAAGGLVSTALAAPLHFSLSFGDRSGPNANTLASTSLADILRGNGEGLFNAQGLQHASFSGVGLLGQGNVLSVSPIAHNPADPNCVDQCRTITGKMFEFGQPSGSYSIHWYFNNSLAEVGEFPPGSERAPLKNVGAHPVFPGSPDFPGFLSGYTPYSAFADLYGAQLEIADLQGRSVFKSLFRSSDCTEVNFTCSAFEVSNNFEKQFSNPVDGLFMHFEGPVAHIAEPGSLYIASLALLALGVLRRR